MPETKQPVWKIVFNDDSLIVYTDETGVYCPEAYNKNQRVRFLCEPLKLSRQGKLIPAGWNNTWKYSEEKHVVWFDESLDQIAGHAGIPVADLREYFCSNDPVKLALAYNEVGAYKGYENL